MRWYILENNEKKGPYSATDLREMLRSGEVSLEAIVLKEGSPVRRRLMDCQEILRGTAESSKAQPDSFAGGGTVIAQVKRENVSPEIGTTPKAPAPSEWDGRDGKTRVVLGAKPEKTSEHLADPLEKTIIRSSGANVPAVSQTSSQNGAEEDTAPIIETPPPAQPKRPPALKKPDHGAQMVFKADNAKPLMFDAPILSKPPALAQAAARAGASLEVSEDSLKKPSSASFKPREPHYNISKAAEGSTVLKQEIESLKKQIESLKKAPARTPSDSAATDAVSKDKNKSSSGAKSGILARKNSVSQEEESDSWEVENDALSFDTDVKPAGVMNMGLRKTALAKTVAKPRKTVSVDSKKVSFPAPAHQMPQVASEAINVHRNAKLNWQRNRINPTSPQQMRGFLGPIVESLKPIQRRLASSGMRMPHNGRPAGRGTPLYPLLAALAVALAVFITVLVGIARKMNAPGMHHTPVVRSPIAPPAQSGKMGGSMEFDSAAVIGVGPNVTEQSGAQNSSPAGNSQRGQTNNERAAGRGRDRNNVKQSSNNRDSREAERKNRVPTEKRAPAASQSRAGTASLGVPDRKPVRSNELAPKRLGKNNPPRTGPVPQRAESSIAKKEKAPGKPVQKGATAGALPGDWPRPLVSTTGQLATKAFRVVSVVGVQLYAIPTDCAPCRVPARLADGSSITLVSPTAVPWRGLVSKRIAVKGLVQRKPGEIWILVQSVKAQ